MESSIGFRIATRGLIRQNDTLLFVSHDDKHWYLPGGRPENNESLTNCLEREVYEETGLIIKTQALIHVLECLDLNDRLHKIIFYFSTTLVEGEVLDSWQDIGGHIQSRRYFNQEEIKKNERILPRFLATEDWGQNQVYKGFVKMRGFEMIDPSPVEENSYS